MEAITYEGSDLDVLADMPNYYRWIMDTFVPHVSGHVVEYGAGVGTVSAYLEPLSRELTLVEPSANLVGRLRQRFAASSGVRIVDTSLEAHVARLEANSVDTFVLVNVLEHIHDDRLALRQLIAALRPGGALLLFVPALQFLMSRLDRDLGHFRRYHRPDLIAKVHDAGGQIETCRYMDTFGVGPWLVLNTLLGATKFNPAMVAFNDRHIAPLSRCIESKIGVPFGKNLILVARKAA